MSDYYERTDVETGAPVSLSTAKSYLRLPSEEHPDDDLIQLLLDVATDAAEMYTGRELRANTWSLKIDEFDDRICLRKERVDAITSVTRKVADVDTAVASTVYELEHNPIDTELITTPDESWPTDQDDGEHRIEIIFTTKATRYVAQAKLGILRHVAFLYENRGDVDPSQKSNAIMESGAGRIYDQFRIERF